MSLENDLLVQRDMKIKGLKLLLNETSMLNILKQSLPDAYILDVQKKYIRYKPGTNCLVKYQLYYDGGVLDFYAKAHNSQDQIKLAKAQQRETLDNPLGFGRIVLPEHNLVICSFPNDDKLKNVSRLLNPSLRQPLLERVFYEPEWLGDCLISPLQYKPERRFVGKLTNVSGSSAAIKCYTKKRFEVALQIAKSAVASGMLPAVIGASKKYYILALDWIQGKRLSDECGAAECNLFWLQETGKHLALFHQMNKLHVVRQGYTNAFIASLDQLSFGIANLVPEQAKRSQSLIQKMSRAIGSLVSIQTRIHGDFYAKQVLVTDGGIRFVDLDDVCCWFPAYDLGLFIAHLEWAYLRGVITKERAEYLEHAFLEGYSRYRHCDIGEVQLFVAVGLMQLAHHPFRNCESNWSEGINALLTHSESRLNLFLVARSPFVQYVDTTSPIGNAPLPLFPEITDKSEIDNSLKQAMQSRIDNVYNFVLEKTQITRCKPGKRIMVEYDFVCRTADDEMSQLVVLGKARAKGLDRRTWALNETLFARGFNATSDDGVQVPEPLGVINRHQMWLQRKVEGINPFSMFIKPDGDVVASRVASAIYKLHASGITVDRTHTLIDEFKVLEKGVTSVMSSRPEWQGRLMRILGQAKQLVEKIPIGQTRCIHRDFYHDQLLIAGDKVYLLDLDLCSMGDPALDMGNFVAHIQEKCLRKFNDPHYASGNLICFVDVYSRLTGKDMTVAVKMYALISMVRHIFISQRIERRRKYTERLMAYCELYLPVCIAESR